MRPVGPSSGLDEAAVDDEVQPGHGVQIEPIARDQASARGDA